MTWCRLSSMFVVVSLAASPVARAQADQAGQPASSADHGAHEHSPAQAPAGAPPPAPDHAGHGAPNDEPSAGRPGPASPDASPVPPLTDADRRAAFPDVHGHALHDHQFRSFLLFDQIEWQQGDRDQGSWDLNGWLGYDRDRIWLRSEGEASADALDRGEAHVLYGRAFARWWDVVAGVRQDLRPGSAQTWSAVGLQGLAPYWFEVQATAYLGADWRTQLRFEAQYELFLTNRVTLQPTLELRLNGKADPERTLGAGLSSADYGLRLRYIVRREIAPYVGVAWSRQYFGTADLARAAGQSPAATRLVFGVRLWK